MRVNLPHSLAAGIEDMDERGWCILLAIDHREGSSKEHIWMSKEYSVLLL
jgi:hypothetical protein